MADATSPTTTPTPSPPPEDRFTTKWKSHNDPAAVAWSSTHNIDFTLFWVKDLKVSHGHARLVPRQIQIPGSTNMTVLRQQNILRDQETREKHAKDLELGTGTGVVLGDGGWRLATRGEKLRTCERFKKLYAEQLKKNRERVKFLEKRKGELGDDVGKKSQSKLDGKIEEARMDLWSVKGCGWRNMQLQGMVEGETRVGREWKKGIEEQVGVREKLLEMEGRVGKWSADALEGKKELGL